VADLSWQALSPAQRRADLSMAALFIRYVGLGGVATSGQLSAHFTSGGPLSAMEHDVAVHAINERFMERHDPERLPYAIA
jgi:hypothetical protein